MIRTDYFDDLDLVATHRVQAMSQRAANQLLWMLGDHLKTNGRLDRATFLLLCDEAEAVTS